MRIFNKLKTAIMRRGWWMLHRCGFDVRRSENWCWPDQQKLAGNAVQMIFDVGANRGDTAQQYLELFPSAKVHCFEPMPDYAKLVQDRFFSNGHISIESCALAATVGTSSFHVNAARDTSSLLAPDTQAMPGSYQALLTTEEQIEVRLDTVDNYCATKNIAHIDVLKMDVQGGETGVLEGAANMLSTGAIDIIYSEVFFTPMYQDQPLFTDICARLSMHGYSLHSLYNVGFNGSTGRIQWADAIFVSPALKAKSRELLRQTHHA